MLENINEFNNQLSHWRQRLTIPNTDQIQVIRDRLDQTVSMVCHTQNLFFSETRSRTQKY